MSAEIKDKCFVIMPISDQEGFDKGHFDKVYNQIFKQAIISAGYEPKRADDDKSSHLIHTSIIKDLIEAPIALCDLSTRNPNVLYELGIRHAFDKPVVLVQQVGTERIFDITGINTLEYRSERIYDEVIEDQNKICEAIKATSEDPKKLTSIIKLMKLESAKLNNEVVSEDFKNDVILNSIMSEIKNIKQGLYFTNKQFSDSYNTNRQIIDLNEPLENLSNINRATIKSTQLLKQQVENLYVNLKKAEDKQGTSLLDKNIIQDYNKTYQVLIDRLIRSEKYMLNSDYEICSNLLLSCKNLLKEMNNLY